VETTWRVIDTGLRRAAENFALNRALLEARRLPGASSTLRFLQFRPSALLGYHQSAEQELNLAYCERHRIDVQRRITGGGAIYMDEGQFGWELYLARADVGTPDMASIGRRICEAAARGLSSLGIDARFRPRNDIEVDGRKISGTGGAFDGDVLMYQGTVLVELDVDRMLGCLRIPAEKLADKAIADARERITDLRTLLGTPPPLPRVKEALQRAFAEAFEVRFVPRGLSAQEDELFAGYLREIDSPEWIGLVRKPRSGLPIATASRKFAGGLVRAAVAYDRTGHRLRQVWFTGDLFVSPRRALADLENALKDAPADQAEARIVAFFAANEVETLGLQPQDFAALVGQAVAGAGED
jgi:lipoate---protein ligase